MAHGFTLQYTVFCCRTTILSNIISFLCRCRFSILLFLSLYPSRIAFYKAPSDAKKNPWKRENIGLTSLCRTVTQTETTGWKIASQSLVLYALQTQSVCQALIQASTWWLESPPLTRWYQAWDWCHPHPRQKWPWSKKSSTAKAVPFSPKIQVSRREQYLLFPLK